MCTYNIDKIKNLKSKLEIKLVFSYGNKVLNIVQFLLVVHSKEVYQYLFYSTLSDVCGRIVVITTMITIIHETPSVARHCAK